MLEIIHDLAPGAQLYFASAFTSITSFANNIRALRAAGCDIIVDDVAYFAETPFQDGQAANVVSNTNGGVVIQAVNDVTADGALYFSSAGNSGHLSAGTSGTWEGDFVDGGAAPSLGALTSGRLHRVRQPDVHHHREAGGHRADDSVVVGSAWRIRERLRSVPSEQRRQRGGGQLDQHSKRHAGSV